MLLVPYLDDVGVYATDITQATLIRQLLNTSFKETGKRITFQGFGNTNYKSREVATGLRLLEKTFLIQLIYPSTGIQLPIHENTKKAPRLQLLDTGLVNYFSRIQDKLLAFKDLNDAYRGTITEHIVFQELLANQKSVMQKLHFWVRDKKTSTAEVDVLYPYKAYVIPIEIKSGAAGRLRSLHQFIEASPLKLGIRLYASTFTVEKHNTISGIPFTLVNIPYFLVAQIDYYLDYIFVNYKIEKS
jgi:hypothetical protein